MSYDGESHGYFCECSTCRNTPPEEQLERAERERDAALARLDAAEERTVETRQDIEWALGILTVDEHEPHTNEARAAAYLHRALARLPAAGEET